MQENRQKPAKKAPNEPVWGDLRPPDHVTLATAIYPSAARRRSQAHPAFVRP